MFVALDCVIRNSNIRSWSFRVDSGVGFSLCGFSCRDERY